MKEVEDIYLNDQGGYGPGENGDGTGSPYYQYGFQDGSQSYTPLPDVVVTSTPKPQVQTNEVKKSWYDVVTQLIGSGASAYTAVKAAEGGLTYNPNTGTYQPAVEDKKFSAWLWVIVAIVAIIILWYFIASKNKQ